MCCTRDLKTIFYYWSLLHSLSILFWYCLLIQSVTCMTKTCQHSLIHLLQIGKFKTRRKIWKYCLLKDKLCILYILNFGDKSFLCLNLFVSWALLFNVTIVICRVLHSIEGIGNPLFMRLFVNIILYFIRITRNFICQTLLSLKSQIQEIKRYWLLSL